MRPEKIAKVMSEKSDEEKQPKSRSWLERLTASAIRN